MIVVVAFNSTIQDDAFEPWFWCSVDGTSGVVALLGCPLSNLLPYRSHPKRAGAKVICVQSLIVLLPQHLKEIIRSRMNNKEAFYTFHTEIYVNWSHFGAATRTQRGALLTSILTFSRRHMRPHPSYETNWQHIPGYYTIPQRKTMY